MYDLGGGGRSSHSSSNPIVYIFQTHISFTFTVRPQNLTISGLSSIVSDVESCRMLKHH